MEISELCAKESCGAARPRFLCTLKQSIERLPRIAMKQTAALLFLCLAGCSSLLPEGDVIVEGPWHSFEEAQQAFDKIVPYSTTVEDLRGMKLDPGSQPNITILNYSDVLRRFVPNASISVDHLDAGVWECIRAKTACQGYEIVQKSIKRDRTGNFLADFLNFRREVDVTGWSFNGVLLIKDKLVVYKLVSGQPLIREQENVKNPLGPLQDAGGAAVRSGF